MSEAQQEYKPQFPLMHDMLLSLYRGFLTEHGFVCRERLNSMIMALYKGVDDNVFSPEFTQNFWRDIQNVVELVHKPLEETTVGRGMVRRHEELLVSLGRLQKLFGGT